MKFREIFESNKGTHIFNGKVKVKVDWELKGKKYFISFKNIEGKKIDETIPASYKGKQFNPGDAIDLWFSTLVDYN